MQPWHTEFRGVARSGHFGVFTEMTCSWDADDARPRSDCDMDQAEATHTFVAAAAALPRAVRSPIE
jgi:hypothetical protein